MSIGIDGIVSGLDTASVISALMQIEAGPQTLLQSKQDDAEDILSALQAINVKTASLASAAETAADADSWASFTATASSDAVTATTDATASAGSLTFTVDAVATSQVSLTAAVVSGASLVAENPPQLTFLKADGTYVTVVPASDSLADIAAAINDSDAGVTATRVQVTGGDTPTYRLQFTSDETGADGAFELYEGDQAAIEGGTATRLDGTVVTTGTDASITLFAGTAAETTYSQSSNTFADLMTGVDITLSSAVTAGESITVTVDTNAEEVQSLAENLVTNLNTIFSDIKTYTKTGTSENDEGDSIVTAGILGGDSAIRNLKYALTQSACYPIDNVSPCTQGISLVEDGNFEFDEDVFAEALADDPDGTASFMQALGARIQAAAEQYSDSKTGILSSKITAQETTIDNLADQISDWDDRLAAREELLYKKFTAMETALATLQSQQSYLESMIASLSTSSSSS